MRLEVDLVDLEEVGLGDQAQKEQVYQANVVREYWRKCYRRWLGSYGNNGKLVYRLAYTHGSELCAFRRGPQKPTEVETGKENVNLDGVEPVLSPGIQEEAGVKGDRGAEKSRRDPGSKTGNDSDNYEAKYPEDKIYEEIAAPNARVWKTFVDESTNYDVRMVGESRESVDLLLVFVSIQLLSPFFIANDLSGWSFLCGGDTAQTSQSLQADYAQVPASLLFEMVLIQRAIANGSPLDNVPVYSLNPYTEFTPATTDISVNELWFTSLSLSLATALVSVLVKPWLHHYLAFPSGPPRERIHVRQYRYGGFQKWHVLVIVGTPPRSNAHHAWDLLRRIDHFPCATQYMGL
ncbi:hypothetical protein IW262DRAFT_1543124 [Armillaria fumosa]|nr:hypothetical protein IW262DRAFT_1543124 [Armillaria fumosa]